MHPLPFDERTYRVVSHRDLDRHIRQVFPFWDGCLSDMDWYPGNYYPLTVKAEDSTGEEWAAFIERKELPHGRMTGRGVLPMLLNYLAARGLIPEGDYLIRVEL